MRKDLANERSFQGNFLRAYKMQMKWKLCDKVQRGTSDCDEERKFIWFGRKDIYFHNRLQ